MKSNCIDIGTLDAYMNGQLSDKERRETEEHLLLCDDCMEEALLANILLNDSELTRYEPGPADRVRLAYQGIKEKIRTKLSDWLTHASPPDWLLCNPSPVRSSADVSTAIASILVRKDIHDLQTEMYVEKGDDGNARVWIKVLKDDKPAKNISLTLLKDGEVPFARFLSRDYVLFEKQPFGNYSLTLEGKLSETEAWFQTPPYHFEMNDAGFYEKEHDLS